MLKKTFFSKNLFAFLAICLTLNSCKKDSATTTPPVVVQPIANFGYSLFNNNLHAPATINFTNSSSNYTSCSWIFGNLGTSVSTDPSFKFTTAGDFNIKLTAYNSSNATSNLATQNITILPAYTQVKITGLEVTFTSNTSSFIGYFKIKDANNNQLYKTDTITMNPAQFPKTWTLTSPHLIPNLNSNYFIELWEYIKFSPIDTKLINQPFTPSSHNKGTSDVDSYPSSVFGVYGINAKLQWQ